METFLTASLKVLAECTHDVVVPYRLRVFPWPKVKVCVTCGATSFRKDEWHRPAGVAAMLGLWRYVQAEKKGAN